MPIVFISFRGGIKITTSSFGGHRQLGGRSHWRRSPNLHASKLSSDDGRQWLPPPNWLRPPKRFASKNKILAAAANWEAEATRGGSHDILRAKKSLGGSRRWLRKNSGGEKISAVYQLSLIVKRWMRTVIVYQTKNDKHVFINFHLNIM